jgi:hypothetical protein
MSSKTFLNPENISMIWDVITDEEIFKFLTRDIQNKVANIFTSNLKGFFESENQNTNNLIDINKKYIMLMLNYIKKNFLSQQPNKIKIHNEIIPSTKQKELITYEEIQNDRKSQFEKDLNKRQEEFTNSMTIQSPAVPEFVDKNVEAPIKDMEKIIKEMTAQRNYEVEQININYQQADSWLKPQETSIKNDKNLSTSVVSTEQNKQNEQNEQNEYNKLRYIKIENNDITLNSPDKRKNVTWGNNSEIENKRISDDINLTEDNIFKKLKKVNSTQPTIVFEEPIITNTKEDRIENLENEVKTLNIKMDMLINLIKQNK